MSDADARVAFYEQVMEALVGEGTTTCRVRRVLELLGRAAGVDMAVATLVDTDALERGGSLAWMLASVTWASDPMDVVRSRSMEGGFSQMERDAFGQLVEVAPVTVDLVASGDEGVAPMMRRFGIGRALVHCRQARGGDVWLFTLVHHHDAEPFGDAAHGMLEYASQACTLALSNARDEPEGREAHPVRALTDLPDFVFVVDEGGVYRDVHTTRESDLLRDAPQLIGASIVDVLPDEIAQRFEVTIGRVIASGHVERFDYELLQEDVLRSYTAQVTPYELDGQSAVMCTCRDLTTFVEAEREQSKERKLASLYALAGGFTHDINNVLAVLMGNLELARLDLLPSHPAYASIEEAERAGTRAVAICDKLRTYTGSRALAASEHTLGEVMEAFEERARTRVRVEVQTVLEGEDTGETARVDLALIVGALLDLVDNASDAGASEVEVTFARRAACEVSHDVHVGRARGEEDVLALVVRDDGSGMDKDVVERALDPFFSTRFTGRGLGLPVVLGVARLHGGALALDSQPHKGTTATVYLPTG